MREGWRWDLEEKLKFEAFNHCVKIHLRDPTATLVVISRPGRHMVLVQGPARSKRSSLAWSYSKGGDSCIILFFKNSFNFLLDPNYKVESNSTF